MSGFDIDDNAGGQKSPPTNTMSESYAAAARAQQQSPQGARMETQGTGSRWSFKAMSRVHGVNINRTPLGENLTKLVKAFEESYAQYAEQLEIRVIALDAATTPEISTSLIVVTAQLRGAKDAPERVAFHTLILEGTAVGDFPTRMENFAGENYEIVKLTSDAWDQRLRDFVATEVARRFGVSINSVIDMDAEVVERQFDLTNEALVKMLAANALVATASELEQLQPGFVDFNLKDALNDSNITSRFVAGDTPSFDLHGQPLVADVHIKTSAASKDQNDNARSVEITNLTGKVDLVWDPISTDPYASNSMSAFGQQQGPAPQKYSAHFIISNFECAQVQTPAAQLLALAQANLLRQDNAWLHAFRPRQVDHHDLHDIGVLGIEAGPDWLDDSHTVGKRIDTKSATFTSENFMALMRLWVRPGLTISADIEVAGPTTWFNGVFLAAGIGNAGAKREIIRSANELTNGKFDEIYRAKGGNGSICDWGDTRVHLGTYQAPDGKTRDIRDIGYVEIANMTLDKRPDVLKEWSDAALPGSGMPAQIREAKQRRILTNLFQPQFKGFAVRVRFEAVFLEALGEACFAAGLAIRAQFPYSDFSKHERVVASFAGSAMMGTASQGLYSGYGGQGMQQQQQAYRGATRWGA